MKRSIFVNIFLLFYVTMYCQENTIYRTGNIRLSIDADEFCIWESDPYNSLSDHIIEPEDLYAGKVTYLRSKIICTDTLTKKGKKITFTVLDVFRLKSSSRCNIFKKGEIFYASVILNKDGSPRLYLSWKDGKPDGYWKYIIKGGIKYVLYDKGSKIKEYFLTNEEIYKKAQDSW